MNGGEFRIRIRRRFFPARRRLQNENGWGRFRPRFKGEPRMQEKVEQFIEEIRPLIQGHGGDVEFVSMEGNTVNLRLHGACHACPHAMLTLKNGIEAEMRERLSPELTVERVMDA
jgi:Fe-S cluster biogenesis protein NfuA